MSDDSAVLILEKEKNEADQKRRLRLTGHWIALLTLSAVFAGSLFLSVGADGHVGGIGRLLPSCQFAELTGYPCATCGMTRSFTSISHGHLYEALRFHLMGPALYLMFAALLISEILALATNGRGRLRFSKKAAVVLVGVFVAGFAAAWMIKLFGSFCYPI